jgi:alpha-ribazole phosphatase
MKLLALRHPPVRADQVCYGRHEVPLAIPSDVALRRALASLKGTTFEQVWTSPSSRCQGLARDLASAAGVPCRIDERLAEISYGDWEGRPWAEIEAAEGEALRAWMAGWETRSPPRGEGIAGFGARVAEWMGTLSPEPQLLVAHAGVVRALRVLVDGCSWKQAMERPVSHLEVEVFDSADERR